MLQKIIEAAVDVMPPADEENRTLIRLIMKKYFKNEE